MVLPQLVCEKPMKVAPLLLRLFGSSAISIRWLVGLPLSGSPAISTLKLVGHFHLLARRASRCSAEYVGASHPGAMPHRGLATWPREKWVVGWGSRFRAGGGAKMPGLHARFVLEASHPATEPFTPGSGIRIRHGTTTPRPDMSVACPHHQLP